MRRLDDDFLQLLMISSRRLVPRLVPADLLRGICCLPRRPVAPRSSVNYGRRVQTGHMEIRQAGSGLPRAQRIDAVQQEVFSTPGGAVPTASRLGRSVGGPAINRNG